MVSLSMRSTVTSGKRALHFLFQPLRAQAAVANAVELAVGTNRRGLAFMLAVMAQ